MELIVVLVIALVVVGPKKLPAMGRSLGNGMRQFKESISGDSRDESPALATASTKRAALAPNVPTMAELGYPIDFDTWYGVYAPAGTPKDIVAKLNTEINRVLANSEFREKAGVLGLELLGTTPDKLTSHMRAEITRWVKVAKAASIKLE
jgi:TatA/E family protein of Tat protein translocase